MISQEQFTNAIESMRLQKYDDKKNSELLCEAFSINEFSIFQNDKLFNTIIDLLSIWFDRDELVNYCFHENFGKSSLESDWETPEELYNRLLKK